MVDWRKIDVGRTRPLLAFVAVAVACAVLISFLNAHDYSRPAPYTLSPTQSRKAVVLLQQAAPALAEDQVVHHCGAIAVMPFVLKDFGNTVVLDIRPHSNDFTFLAPSVDSWRVRSRNPYHPNDGVIRCLHPLGKALRKAGLCQPLDSFGSANLWGSHALCAPGGMPNRLDAWVSGDIVQQERLANATP